MRVQVPLLRSNAYFQAYWGDTNLASVPAQCSTNGSVWANGYAAVWHLANLGGVLSTNDSTGNGNYGSNYNVTATSGVVGGGAYFNGGAALAINQATNPMLANQQVTMSAWVNPVCCNGTVFMMEGNDNSAFSWGLELGANATLLFTLPNGGTTDWLNDGGITPENQWTYTTGVISGTNKSLYVNGLLKAHDNFSGSLNGGKLPFWIGAQNRAGYNYYITGAMDEVRLSSVARSTNWIWAEYMNMASNALFNSYSAVQPNVHLNLSATGSPLSGSEPLAVQFTATGTINNGTALTYAWTFGDGGTSTNQNPLHTYNNLPGGTYVAQVTGSDGLGDTNVAPVTVTVNDSTPPAITCPANVTVNANAGVCYATGVVLGTPTASDNCGSVTVTSNAPAQFNKGVTTVTWTATDPSGNTATCTQTVTVNDTQPPTISCPANVTVNANAGVCYATGVVLGTPTASDNCGSVTVTSNAPSAVQQGCDHGDLDRDRFQREHGDLHADGDRQ